MSFALLLLYLPSLHLRDGQDLSFKSDKRRVRHLLSASWSTFYNLEILDTEEYNSLSLPTNTDLPIPRISGEQLVFRTDSKLGKEKSARAILHGVMAGQKVLLHNRLLYNPSEGNVDVQSLSI